MSLLIKHFYQFGRFTLDTDQRVLLRQGKPVPLTPKVFDTLLILVENNGRIVEKEQLMNRLWPDSFVEEANLTSNIQQLRKSLGDNARDPVYIETVARRGYRFIANVEEILSDRSPTSSQFTERSETAPRSLPADQGDKREIASQELEPAINAESQGAALASLDAMRSSDAATRSLTKRPAALGVVIVLVLAIAGLVFWKFSNDSNKSSSEDKRVEGKSVVASPLQFEKLTATGQSGLVAISPDGKFLAYTQNIKKEPGIWLRQLATNLNFEIVPPTGPVYGLAFASSGEYLYFVKGAPTALYRVSLHGGVPTKILDKLEGNFSISPGDSQIAFIRPGMNRDGQLEYDLNIANSDGTGERTLFGGISPDKPDVPVWSPDGQSILCSYGNSEAGGLDMSVVEVRVVDGTKRELSSDKFFHITKMAWLPHKGGLIMSARKNLGDNNQLWRVSYPSGEISQITEGLSSYLDLSIAPNSDTAVASQATRISDIWIGSSREPRNLKKITQAIDNFCWTPDGRLVYSSTAGGNRDLWVMQPDGTEERQLTVKAAVNGTPAVTPNNRYVVLMSNRTDTFQVWRVNFDGSNQTQLTNGAGKNYPAISPDGRSVLYNSTDYHLWKVSIDGGEPVSLTEYLARYPAISPDGKMIACVGRNGPKRKLSILILPFEGGEPLKAVDFAGGDFSGSRIQWTPDGKALIYAAERDGVTAIVKQALEGGLPEEIANFDEDVLFDFGYSIDGRFLAVTRGGWQHDIVLITDLDRH